MKKISKIYFASTNLFIVLISSLFFCEKVHSQDQTLNPNNKPQRESVTIHKAVIIPFEPKLYMSEIDRSIYAETNLSAREIKHKFRDGLNEQIYKAFRAAKFGAVDFMEDTLKFKKDVESIYQFLTYDYVKVPDQQKYKTPKKEKEEKKIDKGQLIVETNSEKRFMNARLTNPKIIPSISGKYKSDVFVFINQLDIKASGAKDAFDLGPERVNRLIVVHYTIYTKSGVEINSGIVEEEFDPTLNIPRKIIDKHFSKIAVTIVQRAQKALINPK